MLSKLLPPWLISKFDKSFNHDLKPAHIGIILNIQRIFRYLLDKNGWSLLNGSLLSESKKSDPGTLIEVITTAVEKNKIIVVTDVQYIPAKLARGFHFLVDKYNPKVEEAIYVLTLKIPSYLKNEKPVVAAEETLRECWKELSDDTLLPLVTRMTVQVLPINAEENQRNCPLKTSVTNEIFFS